MALVIEDDPIEAFFYDLADPELPESATGVVSTTKKLCAYRCHVKSHDEKTNKADLVVWKSDRRSSKSDVPYGAGKPGHWGWPKDKGNS